MPLRGNGTRAGSVPLDAIDAEEIADLLGCAAAALAAVVGDPAAADACAGLAGDWEDLEGLHAAVALACSGRILSRWFDLGLRHRHDRHSCLSRWLTGCW
jgi:hypothetical protein